MSGRGIDRREAVRRLALGGLGSAAMPAWAESLAVLADGRAHGPQAPGRSGREWKPAFLDAHQDATVAAISDCIIPETDTPGAKAALVNRFIDGVLAAAPEPEQREFLLGLRSLDARSRALFGSDFVAARPDEQTALLTSLSAEDHPAVEDETGRGFWKAVKAMTVAGYYGSEIGLTRELGDSGQMFFLEFEGCRHREHE